MAPLPKHKKCVGNLVKWDLDAVFALDRCCSLSYCAQCRPPHSNPTCISQKYSNMLTWRRPQQLWLVIWVALCFLLRVPLLSIPFAVGQTRTASRTVCTACAYVWLVIIVALLKLSDGCRFLFVLQSAWGGGGASVAVCSVKVTLARVRLGTIVLPCSLCLCCFWTGINLASASCLSCRHRPAWSWSINQAEIPGRAQLSSDLLFILLIKTKLLRKINTWMYIRMIRAIQSDRNHLSKEIDRIGTWSFLFYPIC